MQGVRFVALDCETTGLDSERDSVIEVGAVKFSLAENLATFDSLFNPGVRLPSFVSRLTGITDIELQTAPKIAEKVSEFKNFCEGCIIIGHNLPFDLGFLANSGIDLTSQPTFDTFHLASLLLPRGESLSLENLAMQYGVTHTEAHRALSDAEATRDVFRVLMEIASHSPRAVWEKISQLKISSESFLPRFAELALANSNFTFPHQLPNKIPQNPVVASVELREKISAAQPSLIETTAVASEIAAATQPNSTIFFGNNLTAREIAKNSNAVTLFSRNQYVCQEKLKSFITKDLNPLEATLAAKLLLHPNANQHELILSRSEALLFEFIAADESCNHPDCQFFRAQNSAAAASLIVSDHASFLEVSQFVSKRIVSEALDLPNNLKQNESFVLDLPNLELLTPNHSEKIAMWWGMLGLLFREAAPQWGRLQLSEATGLSNYSKVIEAGKSFLEVASSDLPPRVISALQTFLSDTPGFARLIRSNAMNEITLEVEALTLPMLDFTDTALLDAALTANDNFAYAKKLLTLPAETLASSIPVAQTPQFLVGENLPSNPPEFQKLLLNLAQQLPGVTVILFGNGKEVGDFYEKAVGEFDFPVFGRKLPPAEKLANLPKALILTSIFGKQTIPAAQNCILVKIPFIVKDNADWNTETLPAAILGFKKLYLKFASHNCAERFITLDSRLTEKNYGEAFLHALPNKFENRNPESLGIIE